VSLGGGETGSAPLAAAAAAFRAPLPALYGLENAAAASTHLWIGVLAREAPGRSRVCECSHTSRVEKNMRLQASKKK